MSGTIDWNQPAKLERLQSATMFGDGYLQRTGMEIGNGTLREMVDLATTTGHQGRGQLRLVIAGGFHLDGREIDDFAAEQG